MWNLENATEYTYVLNGFDIGEASTKLVSPLYSVTLLRRIHIRFAVSPNAVAPAV